MTPNHTFSMLSHFFFTYWGAADAREPTNVVLGPVFTLNTHTLAPNGLLLKTKNHVGA